MKKLVLPLLLSLVVLSGCAHAYVMRLNNGMRISSTSKPRLEKGNYYYKDATGRKMSVPAGRVIEIVPASMAEEEKTRFKPTPVPQ